MEIRNYDPAKGDFPQGDLCIFPIPESIKLSAVAVEIAPIDGRLILQEGEVSGHHHAIVVPRVRRFRPETARTGDPTIATRDAVLASHFGGGKAKTGHARLYRDQAAISALVSCGELTRTDLAIGILVVEGGPVMLGHEEHDTIRLPDKWTDAAGNPRSGRYYVGRQIESAGAEERMVAD